MSNTRKPKTLADITAVTKPLEKIVKLCVRGDLFARWEQLDDELDQMHTASLGRRSAKLNDTGDDPEVVAKAEEVEAVQAQMAKFTYEFRFQKLPGTEWDDLISAHEPRKGNAADLNAGIDLSRFPKAAVKACCVEPDMSNGDEFEEFWAKLNAGQRTLLYVDGARSANQAGASVPKSAIASDVIRGSKQSSTT